MAKWRTGHGVDPVGTITETNIDDSEKNKALKLIKEKKAPWLKIKF